MYKNGITVHPGPSERGMGDVGVPGARRGADPGFKPQIPEEFREIMKKKQEERLRGIVVAKQE